MPIYEYSCENCGKITEILVNKEKDDTVCKYCGSVRLKKLISVPGAIIMGNPESKGTTCCGRDERCDTPPCSDNGICKRG